MKNNISYRLAARLCGDKLTLMPETFDEIRQLYVPRLNRLDKICCENNRAAFAGSVEYERLGDFCRSAGMYARAAAAYRNAADLCFCGRIIDNPEWRGGMPSAALRQRLNSVMQKINDCCRECPQLLPLFRNDSSFRLSRGEVVCMR